MAVHSRAMGITRGERIRRVRQLRRLSLQALANATGVGMRTIGRIEKGESQNSANLTVLETYLGIAEDATGDAHDHATPSVSLTSATTMEILAELARRYAAYEAAEHRVPDQSIGDWRWSKEGAPSARRHPEDDVSNGSAVDQGQ